MATYQVFLDQPVADGWQSLKRRFPTHYIVGNNTAFIHADDTTMIRDICDVLGMNNHNDKRGFFIEVYNQRINGWYSQSLWEWIGKHD